MTLPASARERLRAMDPLRVDVLIAALYLAESAFELVVLLGGAPHRGWAALCMLGVTGALALRRRLPVAATALAMASFVGFQPLGREINDNIYLSFFAVLFVLFSFGLGERDGRRLVAGVAVAFAATVLATSIDAYPSTFADLVVGAAVIACGPILLGRVISNRSRLNATLRAKGERLRRERAAQAEQAAADERTRIAGELHDVVAHAMSAMVVQAGAARRLAERKPERAREAFAAVEGTGRDALVEIRSLLGVLRREDEQIGLAPQPSMRHLEALLRHTQAAGLPVGLSVDGEPRPLPPGVDLTAYRLVQEALGGALERGAAGRAEVTVRYGPDVLDLEVTDNGGGERPLTGVRERVSLYGGQLHAGRRRGGGHAVRARLPVGGGS